MCAVEGRSSFLVPIGLFDLVTVSDDLLGTDELAQPHVVVDDEDVPDAVIRALPVIASLGLARVLRHGVLDVMGKWRVPSCRRRQWYLPRAVLDLGLGVSSMVKWLSA